MSRTEVEDRLLQDQCDDTQAPGRISSGRPAAVRTAQAAPGRNASCAPARSPPSTNTWSSPRAAGFSVAARPARSCSRAAANRGSARVPRNSSSSRLPALRRPVGEPHLPIQLAFFFKSRAASTGPRLLSRAPPGATESLLSLDAWQELETANPVLLDFEPDVEALLVNRVGSSREYYRVPIDECYKLVGLLRVSLARSFRRHGSLARNPRSSSTSCKPRRSRGEPPHARIEL